MTPLHFEDVEVGFRFETPSRTVTEADLVAFAGVSGDFNPLHTDAVFAAQTIYGERIAHGALILSLATGLRQRAGLFDGTLHGPARDPELALHSAGSDRRHDPRAQRGQGVTPSSKPDRGIMVQSVEVVNQTDEVVNDGELVLLLKRR